ncbi:HIT family protein [Nocardiopsis sp. MG754419]|uniref:HIT family protein n=1 Tax=Nocardiopsis sp. MG754419 TaxID=2259865 RepID=UPI001BA7E791|nr:HIT family protein [Nocardiopsis sp. MG754419]MBR8745144.1 HIT family protein [Nocardiopsis sp. MG754419]
MARHTVSPCVFCEITQGRAPATVVRRWADALAIVPLNPVTEGHLLVLPIQHVSDATTAPAVTAMTVMHAATLLAESGRPANLIANVGREATQSVFHLHWHIVPRTASDGLRLPWST